MTNSHENPTNPEIQKFLENPVTQPYAKALHMERYNPDQQLSILALLNAELANLQEAQYYPYIQAHIKKIQEGSGLGKRTILLNLDGMRVAREAEQGFWLDPYPKRELV